MRKSPTLFFALALILLVSIGPQARAADRSSDQESVGDLPKHALERSQITTAGAPPFHLVAKIVEATNPKNEDYRGEIEEFWAAPDRWRRTIKTAAFSETLVVNGNEKHEEFTGDYFPNWLRTLVSAIFDPGAVFQGVDLSQASDDPVLGSGEPCRRLAYRVGTAPATNTVFANYCFRKGLLDSVGKPGYHAAYSDYRKFDGKEVARKIREYIEPGTELEATITDLSALNAPDGSLFAVQHPTSGLQTITVKEETLRSLTTTPLEMQWPPVRGGKTSGVLSVYVCLDRRGAVRETYGLNSDHPDMTDAVRQQIALFLFKPASTQGQPVQVEGMLTFAYQTKIEDPYPVLTDKQAREAAEHAVEPPFPLALPSTVPVTVTIRILVGEDGLVHSMSPGETPSYLILPVVQALKQWKFRPYMRSGKATPFNADLVFPVRWGAK